MSDVVEKSAGEYVMREGEESTTMYFVQSGSLAVYKLKGNVEQQIGTIYAGELVGEMSFLDKEPRCATVKAISDCSLLVIPSVKFEKIFNELPKWYKALVNTLLGRLRKANSRVRI